MDSIELLITAAKSRGASDLHLEAGIPVAIRVRGKLIMLEQKIDQQTLLSMARNILGPQQWSSFLARRSFDLSKTIAHIRCRINIFQTSRGVGIAIRLLSPFVATIESLNLHPDLKELAAIEHGLLLVSGATGSGKSTSIAAIVQEINTTRSSHIISLESPIEYTLVPNKSLIRQREVGRDTPSFDQALYDAMREDPDVLVVGEMRDTETMRLTLTAAETGHLVISTLHSSTCAEALQRIVSAFPAEIQAGVCAQLADCLVAVVCQRLQYNKNLQLRYPECEILHATSGVKAIIRQGQFFKIPSALETGGSEGMWSFERYRRWLERRSHWHLPDKNTPPPADTPPLPPELADLPPLDMSRQQTGYSLTPSQRSTTATDRIILDSEEQELEDIISELSKR